MPAKTKTNDKTEGRDRFATPVYATELLLPFLKPNKLIWEPAAGEGRMAQVLERTYAVWRSDLAYADAQGVITVNEQWDFLKQIKPDEWMQENVDYIITNPPFSHKRDFYWRCRDYWNRLHIPFALLIPADYSGWVINACRIDGCVKIVPTRRIDYITPNMLQRINADEAMPYVSLDVVPIKTLRQYTSSDFHSLWLTQGIFPVPYNNITEHYVDLTNEQKDNIL